MCDQIDVWVIIENFFLLLWIVKEPKISFFKLSSIIRAIDESLCIPMKKASFPESDTIISITPNDSAEAIKIVMTELPFIDNTGVCLCFPTNSDKLVIII